MNAKDLHRKWDSYDQRKQFRPNVLIMFYEKEQMVGANVCIRALSLCMSVSLWRQTNVQENQENLKCSPHSKYPKSRCHKRTLHILR